MSRTVHCRYGLYRQVWTLGNDCLVGRPGADSETSERIMTNRRDAVTLAHLWRRPRHMRRCATSRGDGGRSSTKAPAASFLPAQAQPDLAAATGRWRIGAGSPAGSLTTLRSKSSFRNASMRSRTRLSACVGSRSNSPSSCRSGPWRRWWKPIQAMRGASFLVAVTFAAEIGDVRFDTPRRSHLSSGLSRRKAVRLREAPPCERARAW